MIVTTAEENGIYQVKVNGITVATTNEQNELDALYRYFRNKYEGATQDE